MTEYVWTEFDETDEETGYRAHCWIARPPEAEGWTLRVWQHKDAHRWVMRDRNRSEDPDLGLRGKGAASSREAAMLNAEATFKGRGGPLTINWHRPDREIPLWFGDNQDGLHLSLSQEYDGRSWNWAVLDVAGGTRLEGQAGDRDRAETDAIAAYAEMKAARP